MSTPAAAALNNAGAGGGAGAGAGGAPAGANPVAPGAGGGGAGPAGGGAGPGGANQPFFNDWIKPDAPEGKDVRDWLTNKNFADPATLVTAYRNTEREAAQLRTAANLKAYPADKVDPVTGAITKADQNQVTAWRTAMGVPATAADYKIPVPANSPYPQFTGYLSDVLHEAGVPAAMAPKLAAGYEAAVTRLETELRAAEDTASAAALKTLEAEWGANYKERVSLAGRGKEWLAKEVGGLNDVQMRTLEAVLGTSKFMSAMWKFGAGNKEAGFPGGDGGGGGGAFEGGAAQAQADYAQLQADRSAGKIDTDTYRKRERELAEVIAGGFAASN